MGPLLLVTETLPRAVLECWIDTEEVIGDVIVSVDFPVSGFTDIDWFGGGPDIRVGLAGF